MVAPRAHCGVDLDPAAIDDDDVLDRRSRLQGFVEHRFERRGYTAPPCAVGGNDGLGLAMVQPGPDRARPEP